MKKVSIPGGIGFFVAPPHGGAVSIGVAVIKTLGRLSIPTAVYDAGAAFRRQTGADWSKYEETLPLRRDEMLSAILRLKPSWILSLYREPLDETAVEIIRKKSPKTKLICWFVEDSLEPVGAWWKSYAPLMNRFYTMEGGSFHDNAPALGITSKWLPGACDPEIHHCNANVGRSGVGFVGASRPARVKILESIASAGIPLMIGGPGWADHPALKPHVVVNGWTTSEEEAEIYRRSLIVVNPHDGNAGPAFVNPRTFAAAGCGALVVCDHRADMPQLFTPDLVESCERDSIAERTIELMRNPSDVMVRGSIASEFALSNHTYDLRIKEMLKTAGK